MRSVRLHGQMFGIEDGSVTEKDTNHAQIFPTINEPQPWVGVPGECALAYVEIVNNFYNLLQNGNCILTMQSVILLDTELLSSLLILRFRQVVAVCRCLL